MQTLLAGAVVLMALILAAHAHDHDAPNLDSWYQGLESPGGGPCCDGPGVDALKLEDPDWELGPNGYRVFFEGQWFDVPDDRVLKEPNRLGPAIVWPGPYINGVRTVRCFMPGAGA